MRRAKIVATIGPAISSYEKITEAIQAGLNVARLNMSHDTHDTHLASYQNLRRASEDLGQTVAIMADLQGPKIRLGRFADGPHELAVGDVFTITVEDILGDRTRCSTTFKGLPQDVKPGDPLLIDDGKVALRATEVTDTDVTTVVEVPGKVSNNKGINLPGVAVNVPALSDKDEVDLRWALNTGCDLVALSFVRTGDDITRVHEIMDEEGRRVPVIAKIEKPQAVENLHEIIDSFDGIMVARGDLGVELPLEEVPVVQKRAIELARRWAKPVIVATQVLETMMENPRPTRAEASDCANAVLDARQLDVQYLTTFTQSGDTARRLCRLRPQQPILAFTPDPNVVAFCSLLWRVQPILSDQVDHTDEMTRQVDLYLQSHDLASPEDLVVICAGSPPGVAGSTNLVKVHRVGDANDSGATVEDSQKERHESVRPWNH